LDLLIEAHLASGDVEAAGLAADQLEQILLDNERSATAAHAAMGRGRVAAAVENSSIAVRCFEHALALFDQLGLPFEAARAQLALARVLAEDHLELAITEAKSALLHFERIGATSEADSAASLLRSWGVSGRFVPQVEGLLTRREQQVLSLLATGQSNQEIADQLYISRRTAAHHVSNLLAKLGVRNRTEAAAYARRDEPTHKVT
jgi:DNA-binding CsgD family transcriptional regulator